MRVNKHTWQPLRFGLRQLRKTVRVQEALLSKVIRLVKTQDTLLNHQKRMSTRLDDMSNQLNTLFRRQGWFMLRDMTWPEFGRILTGEPRGPPDCVSGSTPRPEEPQPSTSATNDDNRAFLLP